MNINRIGGPVQTAKPTQHEKKGQGKAFADVLNNTIKSGHPEDHSIKAPIPMYGVAPLASGEGLNADRQVLRRASNLLDVMEKYAYALNDPKRTLKSIEPIVSKMRNAIDELQIQDREQHDELEKIVNEIAVTASVEALKFQRGDHLG